LNDTVTASELSWVCCDTRCKKLRYSYLPQRKI